ESAGPLPGRPAGGEQGKRMVHVVACTRLEYLEQVRRHACTQCVRPERSRPHRQKSENRPGDPENSRHVLVPCSNSMVEASARSARLCQQIVRKEAGSRDSPGGGGTGRPFCRSSAREPHRPTERRRL